MPQQQQTQQEAFMTHYSSGSSSLSLKLADGMCSSFLRAADVTSWVADAAAASTSALTVLQRALSVLQHCQSMSSNCACNHSNVMKRSTVAKMTARHSLAAVRLQPQQASCCLLTLCCFATVQQVTCLYYDPGTQQVGDCHISASW